MNVWEIEQAVVGHQFPTQDAKWRQLLSEGWEPFAVTPSEYEGYVYHFRRRQWVEEQG